MKQTVTQLNFKSGLARIQKERKKCSLEEVFQEVCQEVFREVCQEEAGREV